ncbi:MAG TPA: efflux RND transporter periplasmic adaptor subunit [Smithella sp.]|nr:efflux RND transporter periplasmic adaptor subunit [Smithella sp.]
MNMANKKKTLMVTVIMLLGVGIIFGGIYGYKAFVARQMMMAMKNRGAPPVTVTAIKASYDTWQPEIQAVGNLRAVRGVDVTSEISGLVRDIFFRPGQTIKEGYSLVQLNADSDIGQLHALQAQADLAEITYNRDKKQFEANAVSRATLDGDAADLKNKRALVAQQKAIVDKKTIRAPFTGRLGVSAINLGQYINPGDKIVTLQDLNSIYVDFYVPQQNINLISTGQTVTATTDTYPNRIFHGKISTIDPRVDPQTRNIQIEATFANPRGELLPGMYASVFVQTGKKQKYLTLPRTAVSFNPYGETVYIVEEPAGERAAGEPRAVRQTFVTLGPSRGDQIAVFKGIKEGETVVTSGQFKLKPGSKVIIDNRVQPKNDAAPQPVDE